MPDSAIVATGLEKAFGKVKALCGVDLEVPPATVFALLGPNGAGKTTTVRILTTLLRADAGRRWSAASTWPRSSARCAPASACRASTPPSTRR